MGASGAGGTMQWWQVVLLVLGILTLVFGVLAIVGTIVKRKVKAAIDTHFSPGEMVLSSYKANFFGLESKGMGQVRGNGALVLTREKVWFKQLAVNRIIDIPLCDIVQVETVHSHLGKSIFRPLLKVQFNVGTTLDAIVWYVPNPQEWIKHILKLKNQK